MSLLDELAARLVAQNVGVLGTNIFLSSKAIIPTGTGPYLTLSPTGGIAPTRVQNQTSVKTQRPTVQVLVRASTTPAAWTMAQNAYAALDGFFNGTLSGTWYLNIRARQDITDMGLDSAGRIQLVFNIGVEKSPS